MDAKWKKTDELVQAALELPEPDRSRYIDRQCAGDERLRVDVRSLLEACQGSSQFLEMPALQSAPAIPPQAATIGRYRLLHRIAAGGMGEVYLAEQTEPVHRQVAIKIVKRGMDTDDILRRFAQERQTLAELNHPNIAKLLDGGATDDGRPYLVMEYVEGRPITAYCQFYNPNLRQRLALFRGVCDAVEHAHRKLVVHRDLKPSNILIAEENGVPTPKLLDFGIAKMLEPGGAAALTQTEASQRPLTPEYASPEQIRGESIGTSADVYSLGVVLYELLTGRRPYEFESRTPLAIERAICESSIPRPSEVVRSDAAFARSRRALAGDLDRIVLTALRKEPERRYGSVERFSEDIRRYLLGLPITARPDTALYRSVKFLRRHRGGVAVAAGFVLVLLAALAVSLASWTQAVLERNRAQLETLRAKRALAKAGRVAQFYQEMLAAASPDVARGRDTTLVRELLEQAATRLESESVDQPDVAVGVRNAICVAYSGLGLYAEAESQLRTALKLAESSLASTDPDMLLTQGNLATVLTRAGRLREAEELHRSTLAARERTLGPDHPETLHSVTGLAAALSLLGRPAEAEPLARRVLATQERLNPNSQAVALAAGELATCLFDQGKLSEARHLSERQLELMAKSGVQDGPAALKPLERLAALYHRLDMQEQAAELFDQVLARRRQLMGPDHIATLGAMSNLGKIRLLLGDPERACELLAECVQRAQHTYADHWNTAVFRTNYGACLVRLNRLEDAERELLPSFDKLAAQFGPGDVRSRRAADALVELYDAWKKPEQADRFRPPPATQPERPGP